jgi:AmmeMemoRadiSam system protein A
MPLDAQARERLLATAAQAIESGLAQVQDAAPNVATLPAELQIERASFVSLTLRGQLRGCCGTLEPRRPLAQDVWHNARASAFGDPRFPPLQYWEWRQSDMEISVLSPLERLYVRSESELLRLLNPGVDGLIVAWRGTRATFLPKVWEQLPDPRDFLQHLKHKAGWGLDFWAVDVKVWRYRTEVMALARPAERLQARAG